jgi:hypothetical protein
MTTTRRNIVELQEISPSIEDIGELIRKLNENTVELNFILRQLTMTNLDGEIKVVTIPAGETLKISHRLAIVPAYRIILRQEGGGVIRDGVFTKNYVELINDGASDANLTIILNKE